MYDTLIPIKGAIQVSSPRLNDLLELAGVGEVLRYQLFPRYLDLFFPFLCEMNCRAHEVYLPPALQHHQRTINGSMHASCTSLAKDRSSVWSLKNKSVAASFSGRLLYAASSQLAISFLREMSRRTFG